jgi:hypothetical protein
LELSRYLVNEEDLIPWQAALKSFGYIGSMLGEDEMENFRKYLFQLLTPIYKKIGFQGEEKDTHLTVVLRMFVFLIFFFFFLVCPFRLPLFFFFFNVCNS